MEEGRIDEPDELQDEREPLLRPKPPTYLHFRLGREPQQASRCTRFILSVFKVTFCSLGLWGHQAWNYIPRIAFSAISLFQTVLWLSEDIGCPGFDCSFNQHFNVTPHKDDRIGRTCYTIFSLAALLSYVVFIGCFLIARRKDSATVSPSESMEDIQRTDIVLLFLAFVFVMVSFSASLALYYIKPSTIHIKVEEVATAVAFVAHWASANTCHVFAVSSFALGKLL